MKITDVFNKSYAKVIKEKEVETLEKLRQAYDQKLIFHDIRYDIDNQLNDDYRDYLNENELNEAYDFFRKSLAKYRGSNDEKINLVLTNDLNQYYEKNNFKIEYKALMSLIASCKSLHDIAINFSNNASAYKSMFQLNDFTEFTLSERIDFEVSRKLDLRANPEKKEKRKGKDWSKEIEKTKELLKTFTQDDKKVLLKAFNIFIKRGDVPTTELIKLTLIISNINDLDIFFKKPSDTYLYPMISRTFSEKEMKSLQNLKETLRALELTAFVQNIGHIKREFLVRKK
ncbi:hypothetical protein LB456_03135 [Psychroflexus sp. CAK57W]|uniref:hypothetical protein n=1 Tax=Psychroflexus curvus TaxID=2873595 RepID=UPI001CCB28B0|nr:hypothetical protein [Psychroflexus curvus]MBZ9786441.1 hypothetical protein [Psychroflexus curvus]